jgi:hypothetical protein
MIIDQDKSKKVHPDIACNHTRNLPTLRVSLHPRPEVLLIALFQEVCVMSIPEPLLRSLHGEENQRFEREGS